MRGALRGEIREEDAMLKRWTSGRRLFIAVLTVLSAGVLIAVFAAVTVPTDIMLPGTQQLEVATYTSPANCDNCHGGYDATVEPAFLWRGGMMANATRDPLFWATLAVAEQDFIYGANPSTRGGAGDLCLKCHSVNGWMAGRSTPTDGSGLSASADINGVECEFCHLMVDPDQPVNITGTTEVQNGSFLAYDATEAYRGAAIYVLNGTGDRLGPYTTNPPHAALQSSFHRSADFCATCHDVSNPATGDLAPGNAAQVPLAPGTFSGTLGGGVDGKAAFNNAPYKYGVTERTFSEYTAGSLDTWLVNDFASLPADLKVTGGALYNAYIKAWSPRSNANFEDGTLRYFTCQTCHMAPKTGKGCNKSNFPTRTDLAQHDQTGAGHWMPDVIKYMDTKGTLRLGGSLTTNHKDALTAGKTRATALIQSAATLSAQQVDANLSVKVTNLTAHKLISGYPEGRRMWINVRWYDSGNNLIYENGAYGNIGRTATDLNNISHQVQSIVDPSSTRVYEAGMGMDQAWAATLVSLGYPSNLTLTWDRMTDLPEHTLGELAGSTPGTEYHSFHFVLNNVVVSDNRIPPYGFNYDEARTRNSLPVPDTQFGNPGPGGTFNYWDDVLFTIPSTAVSAQIRLYYQQTSWEYIQFLWKQNDGLNAFLGAEGINMLDAWLNNGQCAPVQVALATVSGLTPPVLSPVGEASHQNVAAEHMKAVWDAANNEIDLRYMPACAATDHTVYYGPISSVPSYGYSGSVCLGDTTGTVSIAPPADNYFFIVVANNGETEGSYGKDSSNAQRPEAVGVGSCDYDQDLSGTCDATFRRKSL